MKNIIVIATLTIILFACKNTSNINTSQAKSESKSVQIDDNTAPQSGNTIPVDKNSGLTPKKTGGTSK